MMHVLPIILILALSAAPQPSLANTGEKIQGVRTFLDNGNPEQAIRTARLLLNNTRLQPSERMALLALVFEAEFLRAGYGHYSDIQPALQAAEAILHEFPDHPDAPEYRWHRASLLWHGGKTKKAASALRELLSLDQTPEQQRRGWLLLARIHLDQGQLGQARSDLLQYGMHVQNRSREQALGLAWMAMIDWLEKRHQAAFDTLQTLIQAHPDLVRGEPRFFSTYIQLLRIHGHAEAARREAERFLEHYLTSEYAPPIRLLHADIISRSEQLIPAAIKEYGLLAEEQAETRIGRQAFMRKLMLETRNEDKPEALLQVMASLKKLADANQLSLIEDEATLDLARLWRRLLRLEPDKHSPRPALLAFAHAASSSDKSIAARAAGEGTALLRQMIEQHLNRQDWLHAVKLWRAFPGLRPTREDAWEIHFRIAQAMRRTMLFDAADEILASLYEQDRATLRGQRIMNERIRLWRDRNDADAIDKSMRWLNRHELTIYRPEILANIARMQLQQHLIQQARQTLSQVAASDLAPESRADYWKTRAEIAEKQKRWLNAASAWQQYRQTPGADAASGLMRHADALFQAGHYAEARGLYQTVPEKQRDSSWEYHMAMCEMHAGETREASERLTRLSQAEQQDAYTMLARLTLADHLAARLLGEKP